MPMIKRKKSENRFIKFLIALITLYAILWIFFSCTDYSGISFPKIINLAVIGVVYLEYLYIFRRNNVLCFELVFIPLFTLCLFFNDITGGFVSDAFSAVFNNFTENNQIVYKTICVNMLGLLFFMLGLSIANTRNYTKTSGVTTLTINSKILNYKDLSRIFSILVALLFVYIVFSGAINTWFQYGRSIDNPNLYVGSLTRYLMINTVLEFGYLSLKQVNSFRAFLLKSNKLYLVIAITVSIILIISGNRGESLQILLPIVFSYTIFITPIPSRYIIVGLIVGSFLMVISGITRGGGDFGGEISIYEYVRDFGFVNINSEYLISYADKHGPDGLTNAVVYAISGIPFLGSLILQIFNISLTMSAQTTTDGLQVASSDSGLGTSAIGDLYYTGMFPFVAIMMFAIGYFLAYSYNSFYITKRVKALALLTYLILTANCVYFVRDMWYRYLEVVIYDIIILYLCYLFSFYAKKNTVKI